MLERENDCDFDKLQTTITMKCIGCNRSSRQKMLVIRINLAFIIIKKNFISKEFHGGVLFNYS
jgi:hypothetical protein